MTNLRLTLQNRILFSFFAIIIVASGLILTIMQLNEQNLRLQQANLLQNQALSLSQQVDQHFQQALRNLASANPRLIQAISQQNYSLYTQVWQQLQAVDPYLDQAQLIDSQGKIIFDTQRPHIGNQATPVNPGPLLSKALQGTTVLSQSYQFNNQHLVDFYSPVYAADQSTIIAVHKINYRLTRLQGLQPQLANLPGSQLYIVNRQGDFIFQTTDSLSDPQSIIDRQVVQNSLGLATEVNHFYINPDTNLKVVGAASYLKQLNWVLLIEQDQDQAFGHITIANNILLGLLFISTILLVIIAILLSNKIAQPVTILTQAVQQLQHGRLRKAPLIQTGDELEDLGKAFNNMAEQLAERQRVLEQTNASLVIEKDRHSTLLHSLTSGVFATAADGSIILFNKAAERITGLKASAVLGRPIDAALQFYHNDQLITIEEYSNQATRYKKRLRDQGLQFNTDNGDILLSLSVAPVADDSDQEVGWVVSFHDITQERELEAMKLDFVSMAAHELRTPLTALRGYLSILEYEAKKKLTSDEQKYLERSVISSGQLSSLVENLLNLSRIERGSLKLDLTPIQPEEMIKGALMNLQEVAKQRGVALQFEEPSKPLPLMQADNFRIAEVLTNLTANAINYSKPENGWVKITTTANKGFIEISVTDNGQGIPSSSIPRMFTKFYRVQSSLAMGSKGTGLGLFISKAVVDAHKGKIWVKSEVGVGSTFTFTVPLAPKGSKVMIFGRPR